MAKKQKRISFKAIFRRTWGFVEKRQKEGAAIVVLSVGALLFVLERFRDDFLAFIKGATGMSDYALLGAIAFPATLAILAVVALNRRIIFRRPQLSLSEQREGLHLETITNMRVLRIIQEEVVPAIFGDASPPKEEIYARYSENPGARYSIALYSDEEKTYVGFASIWPLTDAAAEKITRGEISENQLTRADIVPFDQRHFANFVLVPGIGAVMNDPESEKARYRTTKLVRGFRRFVDENYFKGRNRPVTVIATGYTDDGAKCCERLRMKPQCTIDFHDGSGPHTIYTKKISHADWNNLSEEVDDLT